MLMLRRIALALVLALLVALSATAQDYQKGVAAAKRGDYATALKEWRPLAETGDAKAQINLGIMYFQGKGVAHDNSEAAKWLQKAAVQGLAAAQSNLGVLYREGLGVKRNYHQAMAWFRLAADQGNTDAQLDGNLLAPTYP